MTSEGVPRPLPHADNRCRLRVLRLDLAGNRIDDTGVTHLAEGLARCCWPQLERVRFTFDDNRAVTDAGCPDGGTRYAGKKKTDACAVGRYRPGAFRALPARLQSLTLSAVRTGVEGAIAAPKHWQTLRSAVVNRVQQNARAVTLGLTVLSPVGCERDGQCPYLSFTPPTYREAHGWACIHRMCRLTSALRQFVPPEAASTAGAVFYVDGTEAHRVCSGRWMPDEDRDVD